MVPLRELVRPAGRRAGSNTDLPVYSVTKHAGFVPSLEYFKKQVFSRDVEGYKLVEPGEFAYATIHLDEGSVGIAPERALISPMYTVFAADSAHINANYLIRYLKSPRALAHYPQLGKGAIHRRKAISLESLGALPVPLPSLDEQRRIATILDLADALRTKRHQALAQLDALPQAIFHRMFGDPDDATATVPFGDIAALSGGRNLVADDSSADSAYRVLKISAVTTGQFKPEESKPLPSDYTPPTAHLVRQGDLLMSRANTTELVGAVAYVHSTPTNLALPDKVWRFNWSDPTSSPLFYQALMQTPTIRRRISRLASGTGGSMKNISKAKLDQMPVPRIDTRRQQEFARLVGDVEHRRAKTAEAAASQDALFASLQTRAFKGEL